MSIELEDVEFVIQDFEKRFNRGMTARDWREFARSYGDKAHYGRESSELVRQVAMTFIP